MPDNNTEKQQEFAAILQPGLALEHDKAWVAASTARRVSVWHAENENGRAAEKVDRERADFAAWAKELQP